MFEGRIFRVHVDEVAGPDGSRATREVVEHPGAVVVLPLRDDGRAVLLRQFRYAVGRELIEAPAGALRPGEEPEAAARRELAEETGYRARRLRPVAEVFASPGFCTERMYLFVAEGLEPGPRAPEDGEYLEPFAVDRREARALLAAGRVEDAKTMLLLLWWLGGFDRSWQPCGSS